MYPTPRSRSVGAAGTSKVAVEGDREPESRETAGVGSWRRRMYDSVKYINPPTIRISIKPIPPKRPLPIPPKSMLPISPPRKNPPIPPMSPPIQPKGFRLLTERRSCARSSWKPQRSELEEFHQSLCPWPSAVLDRLRGYKLPRSLSAPTD